MNAWILTGGEIFPEYIHERPAADDLCIAADAGWKNAERLGIRPSILLGDFDSLGAVPPHGEELEVLTVPAEKDMTDTQLAVEVALRRGARELTIVGGLGGRLDHTLSNLAILEDLAGRGVRAVITSGHDRVRRLHNDSLLLARTDYPYLSLLACEEKVRGVSIEGVKYPLKNATLHRSFQYAVSNEIDGNCCLISVRRGTLLVVESRD